MNPPLIAPDVPVDLSNCDLEPIHIPSLIQPHGMLLAARNSDLRIVYVSANSEAILGVAPASIQSRTLLDVLGEEAVVSMQQALGDEAYVPKDIRTFSFPISSDRRFDVTAHRTRGLLCIELEVALEPRRWDLLSSHLETAMHVLGGAKTLPELYAAIPPLVRELTGYDRVMVYKFDADGHGEVVGEAKAPAMEPFLGLHYPATDIPRQARELYLQQRFRTIVDVNYVPVALLGDRELIHDEPLDMTYCSLRSVSPIHIEYLQNMGVGATLAISLIPAGALWGLIVGHHRTSKQLPPESRVLCDLLGQLISLVIGSAQQASTSADLLHKKSLLDVLNISMEEDLLADNGFAGSAQSLLALVCADGAIVRLGGQFALVGSTPPLDESLSLFAAFQAQLHQDTLSTNAVGEMLPAFAPLASSASGALFVRFQEPHEGILWLRGEIVDTVRWAGKPDASKEFFEGSFRLSPRKSFALWEQVQQGRSLPWLPREAEAGLGVQRIAVRALLQRSEAKLVKIQHTDSLTGLGNRLELFRRKALWRAKAPQQPAALLFIDLDEFRAINDLYGHPVGDEFLRWIGARLGFLTEGKHFIAHLSGDEFAIFCEDTTIPQAEELAAFILKGLAEPFEYMGISLSSTASIGIAPVAWVVDRNTRDPLRVADSAMYVAKHKGGNQFSIIESREQAEILRATIAEELVARRIAAGKLLASYKRFDAVLESTSDNVVTIGYDWTMLYANQKAMENIPDFKVGGNYWNSFPSIIGTPAEKALRTAMSKRTEQRYEIFFAPYQRWYQAKAFPVAEGISLFFHDVTEEKRYEEQLTLERLLREKRIEALTHMAAGLAHEISNPLAIIHGLTSNLVLLTEAKMPPDPHEIRLIYEKILKTTSRASNILRGLRGFAREAAQDPMELASIYEIVDQSLELLQTRLERHHVEVTLDLESGLPLFLCREVQIGQIITNLLSNAFDAITLSNSNDRWVILSVRSEANQLLIDVTDSGPGIEDHFKAHLMEPFFTTKELGLGMGIGLSLSRAIAQDHNGTLTLLEGTEHTTFRLTLPNANETLLSPEPHLEGVPS